MFEMTTDHTAKFRKMFIGRDTGRHHLILTTTTELAELCGSTLSWASNSWYGYTGPLNARNYLTNGDLAAVAPSDELLAKMEEAVPAPTVRGRWVNDVVGSMPDVGAFLAGAPASMRRRIKENNDRAPIRVMLDLTCSASFGTAALQRRGAAVLALVRALSSRRPVELYVGAALDNGRDLNGQDVDTTSVWVKIDTAPLDLARAAFMMTNPGFFRGALYELMYTKGCGCGPYSFLGAWRSHGGETAVQVTGAAEGDQLLWLGPLLHKEPITEDPAKWVIDHIRQLGQDEEEEREAA
jgi:hypothetical protein